MFKICKSIIKWAIIVPSTLMLVIAYYLMFPLGLIYAMFFANDSSEYKDLLEMMYVDFGRDYWRWVICEE